MDIDIDIDMVILENIDIDIDIDKKYQRNIDIDKEILKISIFNEDLNNTSFYIYGYCSELYRMTFHEKVIKKAFFAPVKHILLLLPRVHL